MKAVLIHIVDTSDIFYDDEDRVLLHHDRESARNYCGKVASGEVENVKVKQVVEVDLNHNLVTELELKLESFKLQLVEKGGADR